MSGRRKAAERAYITWTVRRRRMTASKRRRFSTRETETSNAKMTLDAMRPAGSDPPREAAAAATSVAAAVPGGMMACYTRRVTQRCQENCERMNASAKCIQNVQFCQIMCVFSPCLIPTVSHTLCLDSCRFLIVVVRRCPRRRRSCCIAVEISASQEIVVCRSHAAALGGSVVCEDPNLHGRWKQSSSSPPRSLTQTSSSLKSGAAHVRKCLRLKAETKVLPSHA